MNPTVRPERLISNSLHPTVCAAVGLVILAYWDMPPNICGSSFHYDLFFEPIIVGVLIYFLIPFTVLFLLIKAGKVDREVFERKSRNYLLPLLTLSSVIGMFIYSDLGAYNALFVGSAMCVPLSIVLLVFNQRYKMSWHMTGITVLTVLFSATLYPLWFPFAVLIPLVAWARLKLEAHTGEELMLTFIVAGIISFIFFQVIGFPPITWVCA